MARSASVINSRFRMSAETQRKRNGERFIQLSSPRSVPPSCLEDLDRSPGGFDLGPGAARNSMDTDLQRHLDLSLTQQHHRASSVSKQTGLEKGCGSDFSLCWKTREAADVHLGPLGPVDVMKAPLEGQPAIERQVSALAIELAAGPGAGALALRPAAGGFSLACGDPPPYALRPAMGAWPGLHVVKLHLFTYSSTRSRWEILEIIPRTAGLSACSTV